MANYRTPGVYVEEISKFPPSVAQVETAIPAFIGYTEKAEKRNGDSLEMIPTRITSLLEYETYFGGADLETTIAVTVEDEVTDGITSRSIKVAQPTTPSEFKMYYSLQLYFANGGGPCYIVSVGDYSTPVDFGSLDDGLTTVKKVDEVTLLLFPDGINLSTVDLGSLYKNALTQCNNLQDRFAIMDTKEGTDEETMSDDVQDFRDEIGTNYLKYGAVYYPHLETILDYAYDDADVTITHSTNAASNIAPLLEDAESALTSLEGYLTDAGTLLAAYTASDVLMQAGPGAPETIAEQAAQALIGADVVALIADVVAAGTAAAAAGTAAAAFAEENVGIANAATAAAGAVDDSVNDGGSALQVLLTQFNADLVALAAAGTIGARQTASTNALATLSTIETVIQAIIDLVEPTLIDAIEAAEGVDIDGELSGLTLDQVKSVDNATYNKIKSEIAAMPITLPPSSAMAGVYARTDANFGVWKAPANTSLNYVIRPKVSVTAEEQGSLNIDTVAGKSVNAIRSFTGKGTLVWGARTLAGNDNEWRYISVRRFFNMVEESVSKASEQFVFEGNDANTWVRVRAMIENFLVLQWKAGALAGAKAEQAFYVRVGLGQTMTAQDILEGRMIIEIGMAVVRPAEFIILRFSHKMQEA